MALRSYSLQMYDEQNGQMIPKIVIKPQWKWLDKCLLFFPMYTPRKPDGSRKTNCWTRFIITLILFTNIILFMPNWYTVIIEFSIQNVNLEIFYLLAFSGRLCLAYYFYHHFYYSYTKTPNKFTQPPSSTEYDKHCKIVVVIMLIYYIGILFEFIAAWLTAVEFNIMYMMIYILIIIVWIFILILITFPILFSFIVHWALCLKYHHYLTKLTEMISTKNEQDEQDESESIVMSDVMEKYKCLYDSFKADFKFSFQCGIILCCMDAIVGIWNVGYNDWQMIGKDNISDVIDSCAEIIQCCCVILMYLIPAAMLNHDYHSFEKAVWKIGDKCMKMDQNDLENTLQKDYYNYLLGFVQRFPIIVRFGKLMVTKMNILTFIIGFIVARYVSYSVQYFYN